MPPAQTSTSVREMTQRLLEQFQKDVRARAQRPPPEQKRRELAPPPEPQPAPSGPASPTGAFPVLAPLPPLNTTPQPPPAAPFTPAAMPPMPPLAPPTAAPAALAYQPTAPSQPAVGAELTLDLGGKATAQALQRDAAGETLLRVSTASGERWMRWNGAPPSPSPDAPRERCRRAAQAGSPGPQLLWPVDVATAPGVSGFGCLTPLAEPRFVPLVDALRDARSSLRHRTTAALELTAATLALQGAGASLRGLSARDVLVDLATGELRLSGLDRDLAGLAPRRPPTLAAPEARDDLYADLHALAVLAFWLLYRHHPFAGRRLLASPGDDAALDRLCAAPLFVFDPNDASNEAVPLAQDPAGRAGGHAISLWSASLQETRSLFTQAFGEGLRNPGARPGASSLRQALSKLRDAIFPCERCGGDNIYDGAALQARGGAPGPCAHCGATLVLPARIRVGRSVVALPQGARLFRHHVEAARPVGTEAVAEISAHPQRPDVLGMKNVSTSTWTIQWPDGKLLPLEPGKTIKLENGLKIQFGQQEGEVRR